MLTVNSLFPPFLRDRLRTMTNVLGDSIGAAVIEHLSQRELELQEAELTLPSLGKPYKSLMAQEKGTSRGRGGNESAMWGCWGRSTAQMTMHWTYMFCPACLGEVEIKEQEWKDVYSLLFSLSLCCKLKGYWWARQGRNVFPGGGRKLWVQQDEGSSHVPYFLKEQ